MAGNKIFIAEGSSYLGRGWKRRGVKGIRDRIVEELWEDLEGVDIEGVERVKGNGVGDQIIIFK